MQVLKSRSPQFEGILVRDGSG